jgi:O-antigen/teichoic acid export membrane protein
MGHIRRLSIFSSLVIYLGFVIGAFNMYLFVKEGNFTPQEYGLTRLFNDIGIIFFSFAMLGVQSYIFKFQPFYKQNLSKKENDQPALSFVIATIGFILVVIAAIFFEPLFIQKFSKKSSLLITYYFWMLPFTFGILYFTLLESFAWFHQKSILTNFLKEIGIRLIQSVLILLYLFHALSFDLFIKLFSLTYIVIAIILFAYMIYTKKIEFNFRLSRVTKKFYKKIASLMSLVYFSLIVSTISLYIDTLIIGSISERGLIDVGIFTLASFIATTIQVPQRGIISAVIPVLSNSWKSKDYKEISRLYSRTSINLLLVALFIFFLIWMNINDAFAVLQIDSNYELGKNVVLILGISKIIDAGTGVNSQIIATSNYWKFETMSGILLIAISIPLNYFLVKAYGINGAAISNLIAFIIYNIVRLYFIWHKFKMQPFTGKTLLALVVPSTIYLLCYFAFNQFSGWGAIFIRSAVFSGLFVASLFYFKMTPDVHQLWDLVVKRFRRY